MTNEQYKLAASAISNYRWMLAAALTATNIKQTKQSIQAMNELEELRCALEIKGMDQS